MNYYKYNGKNVKLSTWNILLDIQNSGFRKRLLAAKKLSFNKTKQGNFDEWSRCVDAVAIGVLLSKPAVIEPTN